MILRLSSYIKRFGKHIPYAILVIFSLAVFVVTLRMTLSRYTNFESGKFDLGNMAQMVFNTSQGRFMQLTDYFGANMPRWGMSHFDPFLIIFVPAMVIFKTPLVLVFSQLAFVIFSSLILFKLAELELNNKIAALFISLAYLFYPAVGFILAWTDFHGVTAVMPFFLGAFYIFEKMYRKQNFDKKNMIIFWILIVLSMSGKEEIPLFVFMLGLFTLFFRNNLGPLINREVPLVQRVKSFLSTKVSKISLSVLVVSLIWFVMAFLVIIPSASHYRVNGYNTFIESIGISPDSTNNVSQENYFLRRYEEFGDTYVEVAINMILHPQQLTKAWLNGSKPIWFRQTFDPLLFTPLLYPPLFAISIPEFVINYTSTSGGVSTANIENHRISLIVIVLFISSIYGIGFVSRLFERYLKISRKYTLVLLSFAVLFSNIDKTYEYGNPVYLWITQAVQRRITPYVHAEENIIKDERVFSSDLTIGTQLKLIRLETKDRDCAGKVIDFIPDGASVSGPDYMGAKLSLRETYAIFPALFNEADFVVADVYARKVSRVLGIPSIIINSVMGDLLMSPNHSLRFVCGNLAVFEKGGPYDKPKALPIQQTFKYTPSMNEEIFRGLYLRDFSIPDEIKRETFSEAFFVYEREVSKSLDGHKLFLTFVNKDSAEYFQIPHLPSYSLVPIKDWDSERYYTEEVDIMIPEFMDEGMYRVFVGLTDGIETRSIYLGEMSVL
jgi:uncharacterized membrane protein